MNTEPTWWEAEHAALRERAEDGSERWADAAPPFSDALHRLLAEVEEAFVETGAHTPSWEDPHLGPDGQERDSLEEEYSRCLDPGKYRILWARAEAWCRVLTARGWAERDDLATGALRSGVRWAAPPRLPLHRTTVLRPRRPEAQPLVLARTAPDDARGSTDLTGSDALITGLVVGLGDPTFEAELLPDCGCDACDSGSRDLLAQLDREILSIVDGSLELEIGPGRRSHRSSFSAGSSCGPERGGDSARITARPWAEDWTPRPLSPAPTTGMPRCS